ncbi:MAG: V-type ATP synthase subunit I [Treponema sp.]|nr:V-type ATP synthase subunit I [Treponema sp.]
MVVPMKKVSLLVMDKNKKASLEKLRELGVVHLEKKTGSSKALTKVLDRYTQLEIASGILTAYVSKKNKKNKKEESPKFEGDLAGRVVALSERRKKLLDYMFNHQREMKHVEKWGEFEPTDFAYLAENGVNAYLYDISLNSFEVNTKDIPVIILQTNQKNHSVQLIAFDTIPNETPYRLTERPLSVVKERNLYRRTEMNKIEAELTSLSPLISRLEEEKKSLLADIEFETARAGMELIDKDMKDGDAADLAVSWISGYIPAPDMGTLKRAASENGWAFCADDPAEDDMEVPTKLKNNKLTELIYPLTGFLEMSPGYRETDISGWFLIFFTLFFGMIFGDAAYGTILFLVSLICIAKTSKKGVPLIFKFLFLMSISNLVWGVLTCSWFGFDVAHIPQILQNISLPLIVNVSDTPEWLASYNANNFWIQSGLVGAQATVEVMTHSITTNLMLFCFSVALVQLGVAHLKGIISNIKSPKVLAEIGQLGMLFGMYFVVLSLVVFNTGFGGVKPWQLYSLIGGFALVFIFGNYEGSILKSIITSFANIITNVLGVTNVFSDIMSYIRLWAVGLAGASIASTVGNFASPLLSHFIFFVFGVALFVFGHGFNMVLNVLSVLVHGVRLNTLEFSSHIGLTWSGFAYKPFAKR